MARTRSGPVMETEAAAAGTARAALDDATRLGACLRLALRSCDECTDEFEVDVELKLSAAATVPARSLGEGSAAPDLDMISAIRSKS